MVIVGLSPTTRATAIAILHNRKLIKWHIHSFHQKWSKEKLETITSTLAKALETFNAEEVAIKIPDELPTSTAYIQLLGGINVICEQLLIKPRYYTLSDLKGRLCNEQCSKRHVINNILSRYPDLHLIQEKKKRYNDKVFEAVAAAYCKQNEV